MKISQSGGEVELILESQISKPFFGLLSQKPQGDHAPGVTPYLILSQWWWASFLICLSLFPGDLESLKSGEFCNNVTCFRVWPYSSVACH